MISGLVGYWTFDEGTGTIAEDASESNNTGTLVDGPLWVTGTDAKVGSGAVSFDGINDYVKIVTAPTIAAPYSMSFWFYPTRLGSPNQGLLLYGPNVAKAITYTSNNLIEIASYSTGTFRTFCNKTFTSADLNKWHHLTIIINSTTDASQWKCYLNNSDIGVTNSNSTGTYGSPGNTNWKIGATNLSNNYFNGKMDDVRIYNRALSASDVTELYNYTGGSTPPPSPTPVNGSCGTTVNSCITGSLSDTTDSSSDYLWNCIGSNGGSTASCSLPIPPPSDTTPPTISSIQATNITETSATITYITNESSDTQIEYGLTTTYGSQTTLNTQLVTSHTQALSNLTPNTTYHYRVKSKDASNNQAQSTDQTFITQATLSNEVTALSCSHTDVQSAVNLVNSNGVVNVPAGNCTWNTMLTLTKPVVLRGASASATIISATISPPLIRYMPSTPSISNRFRLTGFTFTDLSSSSYGIVYLYQNTATPETFRIDHNIFYNQGSRAINITGTFWGVVDNNTFNNSGSGAPTSSYGNNDVQWNTFGPTRAFGNQNNLFYEDNVYNTTSNGMMNDGGQGGRYISRYNTFNGNFGYIYDFHGNQPGGFGCYGASTCGNASTMIVEIYGNLWNRTTSGYLNKTIDQRGGMAMVHNNKLITTTVGTSPMIVREEYSDDLWPVNTNWIQHSTNSYYWSNLNARTDGTVIMPLELGTENSCSEPASPWIANHLYGSAGASSDIYSQKFTNDPNGNCWKKSQYSSPMVAPYLTGSVEPDWTSVLPRYTLRDGDINWLNMGRSTSIAENVDFFTQRIGIFDGSGLASNGGGVGAGTLANRPSTCTVGVGYWATNQTSILADVVGDNPTTSISGTLFKCTAPNTWTAYYTPFTYPHPVRTDCATYPTLCTYVPPPASAPSGGGGGGGGGSPSTSSTSSSQASSGSSSGGGGGTLALGSYTVPQDISSPTPTPTPTPDPSSCSSSITSSPELFPSLSSALTSSQIQSILNLLLAFQADQQVVNDVHCALLGYEVTSTPTSTTPAFSHPSSVEEGTGEVGYHFTQWLTVGAQNQSVRNLQIRLNELGYTIAQQGPGSPSNETTYFGPATESALRRLQCDLLSVCSGTPATTGYGATGPRTREVLNGN
ncbi:MAG: LamG-like jellyroll fold domain-containing protein [bacterium]|nr:LamG-like jellyroll fold domain-containing protein [bacterium]